MHYHLKWSTTSFKAYNQYVYSILLPCIGMEQKGK